MVSQINKSSLLDQILSLAYACPGSLETIGIARLHPREVFSLWSATQTISLLIFLGYRVYLLYYSSQAFPLSYTISEVALCCWLFLLIPSLSSWFRREFSQPGAMSDHYYIWGTDGSIFKPNHLGGSISVTNKETHFDLTHTCTQDTHLCPSFYNPQLYQSLGTSEKQ